jgi:hypothetical protein
MSRLDWERTAPAEKRRILSLAFEFVRYDHREKKVHLRIKNLGEPRDSADTVVPLRARLFDGARLPDGPVGLRGPRTPERLASVARLMALAHRLDNVLRDGIVANYTELAQYASVTRARISQIMNLLNLAPTIQERLLFVSSADAVSLTERSLQQLASVADWRQQAELFAKAWGGAEVS